MTKKSKKERAVIAAAVTTKTGENVTSQQSSSLSTTAELATSINHHNQYQNITIPPSNIISSTIKNNNNKNVIWIDPIYIRYQHSKIRYQFSSCGRTLEQTYNEIRDQIISPIDIPHIQVLVGPIIENDNGQYPQQRWYFSLNNRRLWVFKRCRENGLLLPYQNRIPVRVREPKSRTEIERYTIQNCTLEAKIIREKDTNCSNTTSSNNTNHTKKKKHINKYGKQDDRTPHDTCGNDNDHQSNCISNVYENHGKDEYNNMESSDDDDDDDDDDSKHNVPNNATTNRFNELNDET